MGEDVGEEGDESWYIGEWKFGMRDGIGEYSQSKDSCAYKCEWKEDKPFTVPISTEIHPDQEN